MADEREQRFARRQALIEDGIYPYVDRFDRSHTLAQAKALPLGTQDLRLAGRLVLLRPMGKLIFGTIQDFSGQIQILLRRDRMDEDAFRSFKSRTDIGDFVGCHGELMATKTGEITLDVDQVVLLTKTVRPLPEKFHGLADQEIKYRKRYLDLISNRESMERFLLRSRIMESFRTFLYAEGYVEVETPILQSKPSGALARPFVTRHNALGVDFALRIAPETYLKRLIVGGMDKVFEMAKCFRNEGMDSSHLQEFTLLEFYQAYANMDDLMELVQRMVPHVLQETRSNTSFEWRGETYDLAPPWPSVTLRDLLLKEADVDIAATQDLASLKEAISAAGHELDPEECISKAATVDVLYKKVARPKMKGPIFLTGHPIELSPLARQNDASPLIADRFQVLLAGEEIVNAYSELADPREQQERFEQQAAAREAGDEEAHVMDEDFVEALEHGMPPTAGCGIGIDRLVALVTGQENLRDVVFFPLMREAGANAPCPAETGEPQPQGAAVPFDRDTAMGFVEEWCRDDWLLAHMTATEAIMRRMARELCHDEELWGIAGLLHDLDFERTQEDMSQHGQVTAEFLREQGGPEAMIHAILAHNGENVGVEAVSALDFALSAAEQITGLIVAASKVMPDRRISSLKAKSVRKRMKEKAFARRVDRERIRDCERIGVDLNRFIDLSLEVMQELEQANPGDDGTPTS